MIISSGKTMMRRKSDTELEAQFKIRIQAYNEVADDFDQVDGGAQYRLWKPGCLLNKY